MTRFLSSGLILCCWVGCLGLFFFDGDAHGDLEVSAPPNELEWQVPKEEEVPPTGNLPSYAEALSTFRPSNPIALGEKETFPPRYVPKQIAGIGWGDMGTNGTFRTRDPNGDFVYGIPDLPSEGSSSVPLPQATSAGVHSEMCQFEKQRVALVYAYPEDLRESAQVFQKYWISHLIWRMNTKLAWEAFRSSHGTRTMSLRVECERMNPDPGWSVVPRVYSVAIDGPMTPTRIRTRVIEEMGTSWFLPEWSDARKFLVFAHGIDPAPPENRVAGVAFVDMEASTERAEAKDETAVRIWSTRDQVGIVYEPYWDTHTTLHELFHMMGAVPSNPGPVFGTGGYHCWLGAALMCYRDKGPRATNYSTVACPDMSPAGFTLDCGFWTYFRANHRSYDQTPAGLALDGWLEQNWNVAGAENRFVTARPAWDYEVPCEACERPRGWPFVE